MHQPPTSTAVGEARATMVHVAVAVLFVLLGRHTSDWLGWIFAAYAIAVLLGSVHLGWHYVVDGYLSIAGALAIWVGTGVRLRRTRRAPSQ